jgi:DNA-binding LacI/PurR family transcriptional regulator
MTGRLQQLGHRRIDCLNVQGHNLITEARIGEWEHWRKSNAVDGELVDVPCGFDDNIYEAGIQLARQWIRRIDEETTSVFCVTLPAAMGVVRAACELDISIGDQLSVCTVDCEGIGKFLSPPIASFERPDPEKYMNACIDWFAGEGKKGTWQRPYLLEPDELEIFDGGSIGRPRQRRRRPVKRRVS